MIEKGFKIIDYKRTFRLVEGECWGRLNKLNILFKPLFIMLSPFFTVQFRFILKPIKKI